MYIHIKGCISLLLFAVILHPTDRYNHRYSFAAGLVLRTISILYKKKKKKKINTTIPTIVVCLYDNSDEKRESLNSTFMYLRIEIENQYKGRLRWPYYLC